MSDRFDSSEGGARVHVKPKRGRGWVVQAEHAPPLGRFKSRSRAISRGRALARAHNGNLVVHGRDGSVADVKDMSWMTGDAIYHVALRKGGGWAVKREGADRAARVLDDKKEAVALARELADARDGSLVVHLSTGAIEEIRDFG